MISENAKANSRILDKYFLYLSATMDVKVTDKYFVFRKQFKSLDLSTLTKIDEIFHHDLVPFLELMFQYLNQNLAYTKNRLDSFTVNNPFIQN